MQYLFALVFCAFGFAIHNCASDAVEQGSPSLYCADLHPQNNMDIEQVCLDRIFNQ